MTDRAIRRYLEGFLRIITAKIAGLQAEIVVMEEIFRQASLERQPMGDGYWKPLHKARARLKACEAFRDSALEEMALLP